MENYRVVEREVFVNANGKEVSFKREWGGHRFTDEEVELLKSGEEITIKNLISRTNKLYTAVGKLEEQEFKGNKFWGFKMTEYIEEGDYS